MRVGAVADLHGLLPTIPACDVLVIAGDVCPNEDHGEAFQARWLEREFARWLAGLAGLGVGRIVGIAGNHDFVFQRAPQSVPRGLEWTYLQDGGVTIDRVRFWGSPWTPWFYDWAFNAPRGEEGERFLQATYSAAEEADVLVVHGPPTGYGDLTTRGVSAGSSALLAAIDRIEPALALYGHIHEGRGRWRRGTSELANVAAVDEHYAPVDEPVVVFDL
jgi:Icc-related predicted phosphoesterase